MDSIVPMTRKTRKVVAAFGAALLTLTLGACGPGRFIPEKTPNAWSGPTVWIESSPQWTIVAQPPIGGWTVSLDQIMEERGRTEVFVSLSPPNPSFVVTPSPVEQRVSTPIRNTVPMWVYARQLSWQGQPPWRPATGPFSLAAKSDDAKAPQQFENVPANPEAADPN
ncbi:MAG: hypothetical protein J0L78_12695 [Planctomycetes bacterium]|nr:hypothetical protein [Planctomycetota bacterium]